MVQSLKLGTLANEEKATGMRRLNRLPIVLTVGLVLSFFAVIIFGLTSRGIYVRNGDGVGAASSNPASSYADQLKRGVSNGIIGEPLEPASSPVALPPQVQVAKPHDNPFAEPSQDSEQEIHRDQAEETWKDRLEREQREQYIRERHRQKMARLQANDAAYDSPLTIDLSKLDAQTSKAQSDNPNESSTTSDLTSASLYSAALKAGVGAQSVDPNGQQSKQDFLSADLKQAGYLPNSVISAKSPYELKRGSVIPSTLITGVNSDLPGRISAQVSQNVYDSATGHHLLVPQGTKLFGRYDNQVSFGQSRVLVVWTDIVFPNASTLQLGGMAGTDARGNGGFTDKVDNHYFKTFGSAVLLALIGTGMDMAIPQSSTSALQDSASDATRRNFAETFGRVAERTIGKNLDVQPTLNIRPGYKFNVLVDQDIVFPGAYRDNSP